MENSTSLFKYKINGASGFALVLLVLVLIGLGERILYDLSRVFIGDNFNYFNDLPTLLLHALFVMVLIIVAVVVNIAVAEKKQKYAMILIPYFVMAIALTLQVAIESGIYFYYHHNPFQFYLVISTLVIVTSLLIYFIQKRFVPIEISEPDSYRRSWTNGLLWILGILLGVPLLLYIVAMILFRGF